MNEKVEDERDLEDDDDFEIEIEDDTPPEDRDRVDPEYDDTDDDPEPSDEELQTYSERVQKRIGRLRYEYHKERRQKEQAERLKEEALQYARSINEKYKQLHDNSQKYVATTSLQRIDAERNEWKQKLQAAHEEGDYAAVSEAQDKLAELAATRQRYADWERQAPKEESGAPPPQVPAGAPSQQPVNPAPDPRAVAWYRNNQWFGQDPEMTAFAYGVHEKLMKDGVEASSDEYYRKIDKRLREVFPDKLGVERSGREPQPRRASPVAPAERSGGKGRKMKLTSSQAEVARRLGIPLEEYAREQAKLLKGQQ